MLIWLALYPMANTPVWARALFLSATIVVVPSVLYVFVEKPLMLVGSNISRSLLDPHPSNDGPMPRQIDEFKQPFSAPVSDQQTNAAFPPSGFRLTHNTNSSVANPMRGAAAANTAPLMLPQPKRRRWKILRVRAKNPGRHPGVPR